MAFLRDRGQEGAVTNQEKREENQQPSSHGAAWADILREGGSSSIRLVQACVEPSARLTSFAAEPH
jgi:hypothetical protein